jgi:hypothetical protein
VRKALGLPEIIEDNGSKFSYGPVDLINDIREPNIFNKDLGKYSNTHIVIQAHESSV